MESVDREKSHISYDFSYQLVTNYSKFMNNVNFSHVVYHVSILLNGHCHVYAQSHKNFHVTMSRQLLLNAIGRRDKNLDEKY